MTSLCFSVAYDGVAKNYELYYRHTIEYKLS